MPNNEPTPGQPNWRTAAVVAFFAGIITVLLVVLVL
jgi:hypothetical protein